MSSQTTAWLARPAASPVPPANRAPDGRALPALLANGLLAVASLVLFALAGASAWLSYHAQVAYVLVHNGEMAAQARVWALLLDVGTAGVSLLRLHETLHGRAGHATKTSLLGCIAASVTMNVLHAPSRTPGGYLVAVVPPLIYAVLLERLLTNLRTLLVAPQQRRTMWRTLALWVNFPALMWSVRRGSLRCAAQQDLDTLERVDSDHAPRSRSVEPDGEAVRKRSARRGRGPGAKRVAFEAALADQVRAGDVRLFSDEVRERNAAAYQAAASLAVPLSRGAARRYVVQALPRLAAEHLAPHSATGSS